MALADERHLALATVSGDVDLSTAQGRLVARMKGSVAAHETEHKRARQLRAARQKAERGLPHWTRAFGYLADTRQPDPRTAPLVKQAYAAILAGASLNDVCRMFNDAGAYTLKGGMWTTSLVSQFLRKPRNAGLRDHNGEIVAAGTWPTLVDESTWRAAQAVMDAPGRTPQRKRQAVRKHLLGAPIGWPVLLSHSRTVLSSLPETMRLPSGLNATLVTPCVWPISGAPMGWPVSASHSRTVLSSLPETMRLPSGLNATA